MYHQSCPIFNFYSFSIGCYVSEVHCRTALAVCRVSGPGSVRMAAVPFVTGVLEDSVERLPRQWSRFSVQHTTTAEDCVGLELRLLAPGDRAFVHDRRQILCINCEWFTTAGLNWACSVKLSYFR